MNRILVLSGAVVVLLIALLVLRWNDLFPGEQDTRPVSTSGEEVPPLPAIDRNLVTAFEIDDGKQHIRVVRSGESWVLPESFDHPATEERVKQLFEALVDLDQAEHVALEVARHGIFEVDEAKGKRLRLEGEGGKVLADLMVGKQDMSGQRTVQNAGTYLRPSGSPHVYSHRRRLATILYTLPRVWLDTRLVPQDFQETQKLTEQATRLVVEFDDVEVGAVPPPGVPVERTGQRVRLVLECHQEPKEAEATPEAIGPERIPDQAPPSDKPERRWVVVEPATAADTDVYLPLVDGMVRQLLGGRFEEVKGTDPSDPQFGLDKPFLVATAEFADGSSRSLSIGALVPRPETAEGETPTPGTSSRYGNVAGTRWVVSIPEYLARTFQKKPEELKVPTAPTPGAAPPPGPEIKLPEEAGREEPPGGEGEAKDPPGGGAGEAGKPPPGP